MRFKMENQGKLIEMLQEMKEIAHSQNNYLTKNEIANYLGDTVLSKEQLQAVYHYLGENHIEVEGYVYIQDRIEEETSDQGDDKREKKEKSRRSQNLNMYQEELNEALADLEDIDQVLLAFLQGEESARNELITLRLPSVVEMAKNYEKRKVSIDDLIAEGNVGLVAGIEKLYQNKEDYFKDTIINKKKFFEDLNSEIQQAIENFIDETTESKDWEDAILAKTNLLNEAAKYMTEEIGRVPTIDELSEYTKISREEINNLRGLSEDAKRVADSSRS